MTITPVAAPAVAQPGTASGASDGVPGEFAALVQQHLEDAARDTSLTGEEKAALLEAASHTDGPVSEGVASMLAALLGGAAVQAAVQGTPAAPAGPAPEAGAAAGEAPGTGSLDPAVEAAATAAALRGASLGALAANAAATAASTLSTAAQAALAGASAGPATGPASAGSPADVAAGVGGGPSVGSGAVSLEGMQLVAAGAEQTAAPAPTSTAVGAVSAAGGVVASSGAEAPAAEGTRAGMVTDQVFPQVTRLVARGDGTHRLMLRLHPADLGEVKVVMTVKGGVVDVTLHAGAAAREALRDGSPQLRSLLELAGATTGQLVVRELVATGPGATQQLGQQAGQQPGAGSDAGFDLGASADDGTRDGASDGRLDGDPDGHVDGRPGDARPGGRRTGDAGEGGTAAHARPSTSTLDLDL